jgi:glyoxylase-like metal-dependent hydrolase (beta-lactamase superfamily II)
MERIEGVHELGIANTTVYVIEGDKNFLIDTGSGPMHDTVLDFMEKSGMKLESDGQKKLMKEGAYATIINFLTKGNIKVDTIICTHYHGDHTGNLQQLKETLKVPVAMHPDDIPFVEGTKEMPPSPFVPPEILPYLKVQPCKVDIPLHDGEFLTDDLQVINLAGHTGGSICLLHKKQTLIAGDCLVGKNEKNPMMGPDELNPPIEMFSQDYPQALKSLKKLLQYDFTVILTSHGTSIREKGKEKLEKMLQKIATA